MSFFNFSYFILAACCFTGARGDACVQVSKVSEYLCLLCVLSVCSLSLSHSSFAWIYLFLHTNTHTQHHLPLRLQAAAMANEARRCSLTLEAAAMTELVSPLSTMPFTFACTLARARAKEIEDRGEVIMTEVIQWLSWTIEGCHARFSFHNQWLGDSIGVYIHCIIIISERDGSIGVNWHWCGSNRPLALH
mgnify:CR=1 FL=1